MAVSAQVRSSITVTHTDEVGGVTYTGTPGVTLNANPSGVDIVYRTEGVAPNGSFAAFLDLTALEDVFCETNEMATLKGLMVKHVSGDGTFYIGGGDDGVIDPMPGITTGGGLTLYTDIVVDAQHKNLFFWSYGEVNYELIIFGTAA